LLAALPLMHVERVAWLAAGVAVASAVALLMRDGEVSALSSSPDAALTTNKAPAEAGQAAAHQSITASNRDDVHRLEDLPVVGAARHELAAATHNTDTLPLVAASGKGKDRSARTTPRRAGAVEPANVNLSSSPTLSPASGSSAGAFDTGAARRILTSAAARASRCASEGSASGSVIVTFAPSGFVQSANMAGLKGQGTNAGCVLRAFQESRVAPFSGAPVTVRKAFSIP
jgi:hypothetical protein